jgi:hypothetical protein
MDFPVLVSFRQVPRFLTKGQVLCFAPTTDVRSYSFLRGTLSEAEDSVGPETCNREAEDSVGPETCNRSEQGLQRPR